MEVWAPFWVIQCEAGVWLQGGSIQESLGLILSAGRWEGGVEYEGRLAWHHCASTTGAQTPTQMGLDSTSFLEVFFWGGVFFLHLAQ